MVSIEHIERLVKYNFRELCPCSECDERCNRTYGKCHLRIFTDEYAMELIRQGIGFKELMEYTHKEFEVV